MGYNSNCNDQNCYDDCCNYYGNCPTNFGGYYYQQCYYYYYSNVNNGVGLIYGLAFGITALFVIVSIACYCYRRRQQNMILEQQQYGQNNVSGSETIIIQNPNQPAYGQPAYNPTYYPTNPTGYNQNVPGRYPSPDPYSNDPYVQPPAYMNQNNYSYQGNNNNPNIMYPANNYPYQNNNGGPMLR